jgi:hypothetical protein
MADYRHHPAPRRTMTTSGKGHAWSRVTAIAAPGGNLLNPTAGGAHDTCAAVRNAAITQLAGQWCASSSK